MKQSEAFAAAMGHALPMSRYEELLPSFLSAMKQAGCTTLQRAAMWCAQLGHESGGLRYMRELWVPTAAQQSYEGRRDLGNTVPGDGFKFRGRGAIQLTGRHNYDTVSKWGHSKGYVPTTDFFVINPIMLEKDDFCFLGAVWYWTMARPNINNLCDQGDIRGVTRAINGGLNGLADRETRYRRALEFVPTLLEHSNESEVKLMGKEKQIPYSRNAVAQDTFYNCGPAATQTIVLAATDTLIDETTLGRQLGTHRGGTDYIGQFPKVLSNRIPGAQYRHRDVTGYPSGDLKEQIWRDFTNSIDAGHGVVVNIVAPPSNYPRGVNGSVSPRYGGGTVYHYIAAMGYGGAGDGRRLWIADSGFSPYGYWIDFDQLCTLMVPKGYAYSVAPVLQENIQKMEVVLFGPDQVGALNETKLGIIAANEKLDRIEKALIVSAINPSAKFTLHGILRVIDATCWSMMQLMKDIAAKHGIDAEKTIEKAIEADNNRK